MSKQQRKQSLIKPSLIYFVCLITVIFIVPPLIVVPYTYSQPKSLATQFQTIEEQPTTTQVIEEQPATAQVSDSPFNIKVYRSKQETAETVPLEDYVVGVVAAEMPISFEPEALKAQSLAARTFVVNHMLSGSLDNDIPGNADITDNFLIHQVYKNKDELANQWGANYKPNIAKIQKAVNATKGQILTYDGKTIDPSFFSTSNGYTENSEDYWKGKIPYLRSVASPWDKESPKFKGKKILAIEDVEKALGIQLDPNADIIGEKKLTKSKRVDTIKIGGKKFSGVLVRNELGLPSNDFDVQQKDENLIFTTRGFGHGVGMSQYGANGMAKEGESYKDIAKYYYQGVEITNLDSFTELVVKNK